MNSQFTISVRNSSADSAECAYQHDVVTDYSKTFTCHKPLVGREVHFIRKEGSHEQDGSVLCEVIVMGHQYTGNLHNNNDTYNIQQKSTHDL